MNHLEQISHEIMVFLRGKYRLDEIGDGKNELKFKQGKRTILTIYTHDDRFSFLLIFGQKERGIFDAQRDSFSEAIRSVYDNARTYHDGKWMLFDVTAPEQLAEIKRMILIKKKPNRKPFPKENAVYSKCGQRCDLCVHYVGTTDEQRTLMVPYLNRMWDNTDWSMRCTGCYTETCSCTDCNAKGCWPQKGITECGECAEFPCIRATSADYRSMVHTEVHTADEITWGILPYVPWQYER